MRYLDAVTHFFPNKFFEKMLAAPGFGGDIGKRMRHVRSVWDLDTRLRVVERFGDYRQILSLGMPPLEIIAGSEQSPEFARIANDGLAELVDQRRDRFAGYLAALPMNAPEAAVREAERAFKNGASGLQLHTNVNGTSVADPRFLPVFEVARSFDKPILLHPARRADMPDLPSEKVSRYEIWAIFGWPFETTVVMTHMIFSGFLDKLPGIKLLVHHMGAMVPFFESRIRHGWAELGTRTSSSDPSVVPRKLERPDPRLFPPILRRYGARRVARGDRLRPRILRRRQGAVRVRLPVRRRGRRALYRRDDRGARFARPRAQGARADLLRQCGTAIRN